MLLSRKRNPTVFVPLLLNGLPLQIVNSYKNLGFIISSDLNHIEYICNKAKRMLGILYRQFSSNSNEAALIRLYLTLVRPLLEYGAEVWHPHFIKDTLALENVQKLALRICSKQWQMSYYDLLDRFKLPTLENCCLFLYLCTFSKIIHNISFFPSALIPPHLSSSSLRSSNCNKYLISFARTEQSANSFILRTIKLWNNLPGRGIRAEGKKLML